MRILTELRGIQYGLLEREDVGDMARVLGDVFSRRDPPAIAVGMSAADIEGFVGIFGPKALAEDLTIVARNSSGELVGAMFAEDFGTPPPADVTRAPASFAPVGALLDSLDDEYTEQRIQWLLEVIYTCSWSGYRILSAARASPKPWSHSVSRTEPSTDIVWP